MNEADWAIVVVFVISTLIGLKRGFIKEALSLVSWALAFLIANTYRDDAAVLLQPHIELASLRHIAAFVTVFVIAIIISSIIVYCIGLLVKASGLSGTDRILGMVFGALRGGIIVMALVILIPLAVPVNEDGWWQTSLFVPQLLEFEDQSRILYSQFTQWVGSFFS